MAPPLVVVLLSCLVYVLCRAVLDYVRYANVPGIGRYWPFIGHMPTLIAMSKNARGRMRERFHETGWPSTLLLRSGMFEPPRYLLCDPRDVEHILKTRFELYDAASGIRGECFRDLLGDGIFNSDGQQWFMQRKLASREFNANRFRGLMSIVFDKRSRQLVTNLERRIEKNQHAGLEASVTVDMQHELLTLTLDAFCEIALGVDVGGLAGTPQPFAKAIDVCQQQSYHRLIRDVATWRWKRALNIGAEKDFAEALRVIDSYMYDQLLSPAVLSSTGEDGTDKDDLLHRMLPVAKRDDGTFDRKLVRDMVLNLIIAGRDTTAAAMSWGLHELAQPTDVARDLTTSLLEELETCVGPAAPSFDNVADCHLLQAFLNEVQRVHPSVPSDSRTATAEDTLPSGLVVTKGTALVYVNYAMGVHPELWGVAGRRFDPRRWITPEGVCKKIDMHRLPVFNAGRRTCLGMDMANLEMKVVLANLLRRFTFEEIPGQDISPGASLTLLMRHGVQMRVAKRHCTGNPSVRPVDEGLFL